MNYFQMDIDGGIKDTRLEDEPTDEKIRITNMRIRLWAAVNGQKQCESCNCYIFKEFVKCPVCNFDFENNRTIKEVH